MKSHYRWRGERNTRNVIIKFCCIADRADVSETSLWRWCVAVWRRMVLNCIHVSGWLSEVFMVTSRVHPAVDNWPVKNILCAPVIYKPLFKKQIWCLLISSWWCHYRLLLYYSLNIWGNFICGSEVILGAPVPRMTILFSIFLSELTSSWDFLTDVFNSHSFCGYF